MSTTSPCTYAKGPCRLTRSPKREVRWLAYTGLSAAAVALALATVAGMIPLSLALGAGSQMLQPLAIAVIGGIIASMVLSLIVTPAVHYYLSPGRA